MSLKTVLLSAVLVAGLSAQDVFHARLATMPIEVATKAGTTGSGSASAKLDGKILTLNGSFAAMQGPATVARLHEGTGPAMRGPAIGELKVTDAPAGNVRGTIELTNDQIDKLGKGWLYVQIHSTTAEDGNLWGWLFP